MRGDHERPDPHRLIADAGAYADFLLARPEVTGSAIGATGYCLGGRMSLIVADHQDLCLAGLRPQVPAGELGPATSNRAVSLPPWTIRYWRRCGGPWRRLRTTRCCACTSPSSS